MTWLLRYVLVRGTLFSVRRTLRSDPAHQGPRLVGRRAPTLSPDAESRVRREGAATLEFAIVAPIVFLLILALLQFGSLLMRQNVLTAAAREGARTASLPDTVSTGDVVAIVNDRLQRGGINPAVVDVDVTPTALGSLNTGDSVSVSVTSPMARTSMRN